MTRKKVKRYSGGDMKFLFITVLGLAMIGFAFAAVIMAVLVLTAFAQLHIMEGLGRLILTLLFGLCSYGAGVAVGAVIGSEDADL
jgi:hypothetical protein